jgi:hypothetical protein
MKKLLISFAALSIATAQQSSRIDDTALKTAGKNGSDWLTRGRWRPESAGYFRRPLPRRRQLRLCPSC